MSRRFEAEVNIGPLLAALACVVLVLMKADGAIDWAWGWVLAPLWASPLVFKGIIPGIGYFDATVEVEYSETEP